MPFVKLVKNNAYFKRFQVKYRRRREGKTDYAARRALVLQDKNKYGSPKYRLVVRLTNNYVIAQVVYTEIAGDKVLASAYSSELPRYGLKVGLKNYAAAYCTGLLLARRLLTQLGMAQKYEGNTDVTGKVVKSSVKDKHGKSHEFYVAKVVPKRKPFRVFLDVGVRATTTGARVFAAMKGAADGGLDIPHNEKRFPGYNRDTKEFKPEELKARIFGQHVQEYQEKIRDDDQEQYEKQFSDYVKAKVQPDGIPKLLAAVHAAIRKDPTPAAKKASTFKSKTGKATKLSLAQRKARIAEKKQRRAAELAARLGAGGGADEDEE